MEKPPLKIGDPLWHPCNMDIIEHKVVSIRQFEGFNHYVSKSVRNVGASGKVEVLLDDHDGKLRFIQLLDADDTEYASGLQDFVEGNYYRVLKEAELQFYEQQRILALSSMERQKTLYEEAVKRHAQVDLIVKKIKETLQNEN